MLKKIKIVIIMIGLISNVMGQSDYTINNKINSPYSRFGIGDFYSSAFSPMKAMGGAAIGLRIPNMINTVNPATYSLQDTLSFILDVGFNADIFKIKSESGDLDTKNANINHVAISFCIANWWGGSLGLVPYSKTGYNIARIASLADSSDILIRTGEGEINKIYFGNSFDITNSLSIGINSNYLFGKLNRTKQLLFPGYESINYYEKLETFSRGFLFDLGFQYAFDFNENKITLGFLYQPKTKLNTDVFYSDSALYPEVYNSGINTAFMNIDTSSRKTHIPTKIGAGISFQLKDKLILAFDYKNQDWTNAVIAGEIDPYLSKSQEYNFGIQYVPNLKANRNYLNKIRYRIGGYYIQSPIIIDNNQITEYGLTAGFGLPYKNTNTMFNFSVEAGKRGNNTGRLLEENYIKINFNVSFYDFWFYKPKFD